MKKAKLELSEFMVMCRQQGYFDLTNIQTAVFEYNGIVLRNEDIESYFRNNMLLLDENVRNALFGKKTVYTKVRDETPSYYGEGADVSDSLVADGCKIYGRVFGSIVFKDYFPNR